MIVEHKQELIYKYMEKTERKTKIFTNKLMYRKSKYEHMRNGAQVKRMGALQALTCTLRKLLTVEPQRCCILIIETRYIT
jgi:hypothetical protein